MPNDALDEAEGVGERRRLRRYMAERPRKRSRISKREGIVCWRRWWTRAGGEEEEEEEESREAER